MLHWPKVTKKRKLQSKRNQWVHHKLASANVIIASRVYQFLLNQILETTIAPLIYLYYLEIKGDPKHNFVGSTWNLRSLWQSQRRAYRKTSPWDYSRVITNWHNCINYIKWNQEIINYMWRNTPKSGWVRKKYFWGFCRSRKHTLSWSFWYKFHEKRSNTIGVTANWKNQVHL